MINCQLLVDTYRNTLLTDEGLRRLTAAHVFAKRTGCRLHLAIRALEREIGKVGPDTERLTDFRLAKALLDDQRASVGIKCFAINQFLLRAHRRANANTSQESERLLVMWLNGKKQALARGKI